MHKIIFLSLFALSLFFPYSVNAHQPNFVDKTELVRIPDAGISRAYYGMLAGRPAVYEVGSSSPFTLYVNVLVPELANIQKSVSFLIQDEKGKKIAYFDGEKSKWEKWYEEFAGDRYWRGPEFRREVPAGNYRISVMSATMHGTYVLSVGEEEVFKKTQILKTLSELYAVKTKAFEKPWYSMFQGRVGKLILMSLLEVIGTGLLIARFISWLRRRKT